MITTLFARPPGILTEKHGSDLQGTSYHNDVPPPADSGVSNLFRPFQGALFRGL